MQRKEPMALTVGRRVAYSAGIISHLWQIHLGDQRAYAAMCFKCGLDILPLGQTHRAAALDSSSGGFRDGNSA